MTTSAPFTVACPSCSSEFPVDPVKVPEQGVPAICAACMRVFPVNRPPGTEGRPTPEEPFETHEAREGLAAPSDVVPDAAEPVGPDGEPPPDSEPGPRDATAEDAPSTEGTEAPPPDEGASEARAGDPEEPSEDAWQPFEDLSSLATEAVSDGEEVEADATPDRSSLSRGRERFGRRDVHERARHLARVLVSDIIAYHPTRYQESLARGTLKEDFETEVQKSWKEYVDQVGPQMAESTPYFTDALNEVLAKGAQVF